MKYNIVIIPFHDYKKWNSEGFRTRDAHIYEHLYKRDDINKILIIDRPTSLAENIYKMKTWHVNVGQIVGKKRNVRLTKINEKVWCLDIFTWDTLSVIIQQKKWWYTVFKEEKVIREINYTIDKLNMDHNVLLIQNPMAAEAATKIKHDIFVFDAIDNWLYHPQMPNKKIIKECYSFVDKNADIITTVSKDLADFFKENKNVHWVANGVDVERFSVAVNKKDKCDKINVGYVGKIQDRVDFNLVEKCLQTCVNCNFTFIGPVFAQKKIIYKLEKKYDNIIFTGDIEYNELPNIMKNIDIAIIPHRVDKFTNSMNPLKLYEYLAAGKPVITTKIAGVAKISPYVIICNTEEFANKINEVAKKINTYDAEQIVRSIPKECTWNSRVDLIMKFIQEGTM